MTRARKIKRFARRHRMMLAIVAAGLVMVLLMVTGVCIEAMAAPDDVPRVLFAETANCTHEERVLVAGVMENRIGNGAFGDCATLRAVVEQPGAFSSLGDSDNGNWRRSRHPDQMTAGERAVWGDCLAIVGSDIPAALGPSGRPLVYYHDKSIKKPATWDNAKWRAVREKSTEHFIFYSIVPANR